MGSISDQNLILYHSLNYKLADPTTEDVALRWSPPALKAKMLSSRTIDCIDSIHRKMAVDGLQQKNNALNRKEDAAQSIGSKISLKEDIKSADYVAVVTARPIAMNLPVNDGEFNVRNWFYEDLVKTIFGSINSMKSYRFNFPTETYCDIFWQGLEKLIMKYLFVLVDQPVYVKILYSENFTVTTETYHEYESFMESKDFLPQDEIKVKKLRILQRISSEIIEGLNRNKFISVFYNSNPIFSIPIIAINPNESNCKVYGILDSEDGKNLVYKFPQENTLLWRIFFWDKVKALDMGQPVAYKKTNRQNLHNLDREPGQ